MADASMDGKIGNTSEMTLKPSPLRKGGVARSLLQLFLLFGIIPMGVLALAFFYFYVKDAKQAIGELQQEVAERIATVISGHLERTRGKIELFSQLYDFMNMDAQRLRNLAYEMLDKELDYNVLTITSVEGETVCKVSRYYTFTRKDLASIASDRSESLNLSAQTQISGIEISAFNKLPEIHITVPIVDMKGTLRGILDVSVNVAGMWNLISKYHIGKDRYAYIIDSQGQLLAYREVSSVLSKTDLRNIEIVAKTLGKETGVFEYEGIEGSRVIGANSLIASTGWGVVVEEPLDKAYNRVYVLSGVFLSIFLATVSLALFLGLRFSFWSLVHPLRTLEEHAAALARGNLDRRIDMSRSDEFGLLFESFNKMAADLQKTTVSRDLLFSEIEERKRAEAALKESVEKYHGFFKTSRDCVFITSKDGRWIDLNDAAVALFGYSSREELMQVNIRDLYVDPEDRLKHMTTIAERGYTKDYPVNLRRKDGSVVHAIITSVIHYDDEGNPVGFQGTIRDITELKRAEAERKALEERLQRSEKMEALGTLAGGVAHDLNNVLGIVVGYSELLLHKADESSPLRPYVKSILKGGEKAAAIIEDLLTLTRRGVPSRKVLNLNSIVADFQDSPEYAKLLSLHPNVLMKIHLDPDLLNISGSAVHLSKSLVNLVTNAAESMHAGGILTIQTANQYLDKPVWRYDEVREGDYAVLSVSDTGEGIMESDLKRIFEPFYTKKIMGRSGTGLGLTVVWGTVKDHQGYVDVRSEEGRGTRFTLYFPVVRVEVDPEQVAVSAQEYMGRGESILVVDDVKEQRDLATEMLTRLNYRVTSVSSGEEAVEYLMRHSIDLVVLDMIMDPGMDGLDAYRKMLQVSPRQKAIIVSGFAETDRVLVAQSLGAGSYVKKPYVLEKLGMAVRKELASCSP